MNTKSESPNRLENIRSSSLLEPGGDEVDGEEVKNMQHENTSVTNNHGEIAQEIFHLNSY